MLHHEQEPSSSGPGDRAAGLEGHLRNLILSNATPGQDQPPATEPPTARATLQPAASITSATSRQVPRAQASSSSNGSPADTTAIPGSPSSKPRKRPNQAQRRQMNSQLSIPIDPRPQPLPPSRPHFSPQGYPSRTSPPSYQRHTYSNSQPRATPQSGRPSSSYTNSHWNGSPQRHGPSVPGQVPFTHHQRDSSGFNPEPMSPHANRNSPGYTYNGRRPYQFRPEEINAQASFLDQICYHVVANSEIQLSEIADKEAFRCRIESISRDAIAKYEEEQTPAQTFPPLSVELKCFGSLSSGFATKASDMDLGLLSPLSKIPPDAPGSPIPRLLEKALLDAGLGARLLTRTRVPIIKLCENPPEKLRQDLLTERFRWENGLDLDSHDGHDDDDPEHFAVSHDQSHNFEVSATTENKAQPSTALTVPSQALGETELLQFKQTHALSTYYNFAKRILRRVGGRDVTISNVHEFTSDDWEILNRVCEAFVAGLADPHLRERLAKYPSLSFKSRYGMPNNRSLLGVFIQIEGEQLLELWEKREFNERVPTIALQTQQAVKAWEDVQCKVHFGVDPVYYNKELQLALDRIKRMPSVQFLTLRKDHFETPAHYSARANTIIHQLITLEGKPLANREDLVIKQYVSGITPEEMRAALQDTVDKIPKNLRLKAVARRHKSLLLAFEFERAIERDLYDASHVEDIKKYIAMLRSPVQTPAPGSAPAFIIPLSSSTSPLVARIAALPDPHSMTPNQPRDRYRDRLEFPKIGVGVQCDINFSAHLALQNTLLLRCYSHTDPRVRPMVLFVKHWAKTRGINSGYRGTLSSYGYVLMVLHYLVNVAQPFVSPNLQHLAPHPPPNPSAVEIETTIQCKGYNVQFWRNEQEILHLARTNQLNHNTDTLGHLLRGFFEYYAQSGFLSASNGRGFDWGRDVLSLRTQGGLLAKQEKGWTGAKTVVEVQSASSNPSHPVEQTSAQVPGVTNLNTTENDGQTKPAPQTNRDGEIKEIRHRYLFAIEDPFELEHNVARTVTHNGIVSIRDEFRRAWRIIKSAGSGPGLPQENLLHDVNDVEENSSNGPFWQLLEDIHGSLPVQGR
ncbi:Fc.00g085820.m01.CDS01 [Cosmosporella sp. VM-42]